MAKAQNGGSADEGVVDIDVLPPSAEPYFVTEAGLRLRLRKVTRFVLIEAGKKLVEPKVPVVFMDDKGREEENPQDPDYILAKQQVANERGFLYISAMLTLGTEIDILPPGMEPPESDEWLEIVESLGIDVPANNKRLRYCAWLKYIAVPDSDFNKLMDAVLKYSGLVTEEAVADAQDAFRGETGGNGATQLPAAAQV